MSCTAVKRPDVVSAGHAAAPFSLRNRPLASFSDVLLCTSPIMVRRTHYQSVRHGGQGA